MLLDRRQRQHSDAAADIQTREVWAFELSPKTGDGSVHAWGQLNKKEKDVNAVQAAAAAC